MKTLEIDLRYTQHSKRYTGNIIEVDLIFNRNESILINFVYDFSLSGVEYVYYYDDWVVADHGILDSNKLFLYRDFDERGILVIFSKSDINLKGRVIQIE